MLIWRKDSWLRVRRQYFYAFLRLVKRVVFEKAASFLFEIKEDCQLNFDMFSMYYYIGNTFNDMY